MEQKKNTKNQKEKTVGFIYVAALFLLTTVISCFCLYFFSPDSKIISRKEAIIAKMDRIKGFQILQSHEVAAIDSVYNKIKGYNPSISASYEENDIKYYLNNIRNIYNQNVYDNRYKVLYQIAGFYEMWFADRKELWSKKQNIDKFKKDLESCQLGLQNKINELSVRR